MENDKVRARLGPTFGNIEENGKVRSVYGGSVRAYSVYILFNMIPCRPLGKRRE